METGTNKAPTLALELAGGMFPLTEPSNMEDKDVGRVCHTHTQKPFCNFKQSRAIPLLNLAPINTKFDERQYHNWNQMQKTIIDKINQSNLSPKSTKFYENQYQN